MTLSTPSTPLQSLSEMQSGFGDWLTLEANEFAVAVLGHLAVTAADGSSRAGRLASLSRPFRETLSHGGIADGELGPFLTSLSRRDGQWRDTLGQAARDLAEDRLLLTTIELCTHVLIPAGVADPLPRMRRLDAVLDILDVPATAAVVEEHYAFTVEALLSAAGGGFDIAAAARAARPLAQALSYFHPLVGQAAAFGLNRVAAETDLADVPATPTEITELARTVTAVQTAFDGFEQIQHADRIRDRLLRQIPDEPRYAGAFAAAAALLGDIEGAASGSVPDMSGRSLHEARRILTNLGLTIAVEDDLRPGGNNRFVLSDANWIVARQQTPLAGHVTLGVRKHADPRR